MIQGFLKVLAYAIIYMVLFTISGLITQYILVRIEDKRLRRYHNEMDRFRRWRYRK